MKTYTKLSLIHELQKIANQGWISSARAGNHGGVGNTLEDLLGIAENNLPIPNAAEWELKTQRTGTTSLITLFHSEPSPQAFRLVPQVLLPVYGWPHQQAGSRYPASELSFRQTINGLAPTDRGFLSQGRPTRAQGRRLIRCVESLRTARSLASARQAERWSWRALASTVLGV
jgi:hypothetical protein